MSDKELAAELDKRLRAEIPPHNPLLNATLIIVAQAILRTEDWRKLLS